MTRLNSILSLTEYTVRLSPLIAVIGPKTTHAVRQDWLQSFESGQWILLPTYDILDKISSHYGIHSSLPKDADKPPLEDVRHSFLVQHHLINAVR